MINALRDERSAGSRSRINAANVVDASAEQAGDRLADLSREKIG
jgi:hypothetical protein